MAGDSYYELFELDWTEGSNELWIDGMHLEELREELRKLNLSTYGNTAKLKNRLRQAMRSRNKCELEMEINESNRKSSSATSQSKKCTTSFLDLVKSMTPYGGRPNECVKAWIAEMETFAKFYEWSDVEKVECAKRLSRGRAKYFINPRCTKSWESLKIALRREFSKVTFNDVRQELAARTKRDDESFYDYMHAMIDISAQVRMKDCTVIAYIIDGVPNKEPYKSALYRAGTLHHLEEIYRAYESPNVSIKTETNIEDKEGQRMNEKYPSNGKGVKEEKSEKKKKKLVPILNEKSCMQAFVGTYKMSPLISTGSDISIFRAEHYIKMGMPPMVGPSIYFHGAMGNDYHRTIGQTRFRIRLVSGEYDICAHVVPDDLIPYDMIIGMSFLHDALVGFTKDGISVSKIKPKPCVPDSYGNSMDDSVVPDISRMPQVICITQMREVDDE